MLSSVLRSPQAIQVNVEIMRAFVRELAKKLNALEKKSTPSSRLFLRPSVS
jgi:hypothetical protein